jgi:C_GCAxxG_C_C family probable redox protein
MGRTGEACGTVTGALMIIGLKHGAAGVNDAASKMKTYELAKKFIHQFKELNHTMTCRDLIGFDIGSKEKLTADDWDIISRTCPKYIADAAGILETIG